ncbi:MAG: NAD(P)/FAD-dependent oxidoreductase [Treponema sp.]|jgi:phytoene dehydrogenase-like protein|nr:NAD(P)/FAD-dependent oxidoreductase [Treponema sp.]
MKKVAVVGAGVAGLSAAIYALKSGFEVTLCEQNKTAGGFCTSWRRGGYLFEGAIHWMTGTHPETPIYGMWKDTGALNESVKIHLNEPFKSAEWEGQVASFYRDVNKTKENLLSISPEDEKRILRLVNDIKMLSRFNRPLSDIKGVKTQNPKRRFRITPDLLPAFFTALRLYKTTNAKYMEKFKHPAIKWLFSTISGKFSAINRLFTLGILSTGDGGYPEGGSLGMIARMTETFETLGGKLLLNTKVKKVNIQNKEVTGVTLENGFLPADAVIVTQETTAAMDQLFDPPLREPWMKRLRKTIRPTVTTFIGVGIRDVLPETQIPVWKLEKPITYAGMTETSLGFYNYAGYEGYAPQGCSSLTTWFTGDTYEFWKQAKEEGRYKREKDALADQVKEALCRKFPRLEGKIDVIDIATPLTFERYTGSHHGSWMTMFYKGDKLKAFPGYCKNIKGLYFAGHRIMPPGGLPIALDTGRRAAQMVCRQFDAVFKTR